MPLSLAAAMALWRLVASLPAYMCARQPPRSVLITGGGTAVVSLAAKPIILPA